MVQYNGTALKNQSPRLLEQVRVAIRAKHYSLRTEDTSCSMTNGIRKRWVPSRCSSFSRTSQ
jgi:hypothetical protein